MADKQLDLLTEKFREFNRFYTDKIGVLNHKLVDSEFSLSEARVLYELAHQSALSAQALQQSLHLDRGYLSRILKTFENHGLLKRKASSQDARRKSLHLTKAGETAFAKLNALSQSAMQELLSELSPFEQARLSDAIRGFEQALGFNHPSGQKDIRLRDLQPGDIGFIGHRQMLLYQQEYGWNINYEVVALDILCQFVKNFDPKKEKSWIAESDGQILGSVFVAKESDKIAKLRLLYVEPEARGTGLGSKLVEECIRFASAANYQTLKLWTQSNLISARRIYKHFGFQPVGVESHDMFGKPMEGEYWALEF